MAKINKFKVDQEIVKYLDDQIELAETAADKAEKSMVIFMMARSKYLRGDHQDQVLRVIIPMFQKRTSEPEIAGFVCEEPNCKQCQRGICAVGGCTWQRKLHNKEKSNGK